MQWADAVPNLLIGLREGLEAGLVVSILLAAFRKLSAEDAGDADNAGELDRPQRAAVPKSTAAIWLGVLGAVMVAGSFAAVLTYSTDALSSKAQQAVGGLLSVLAVVLVTAMIFWMRRTARFLSAQIRGEVAHALALGAGALTLTAFLAVSREGLETTLFIWTAVKASGSTIAPLVGAALGLAAAVIICWLLFEQAVRINLGVFFNRTAFALIVIAAGVFAYGLGDLQDAGWLPGQKWIAFDLTAHIDPNSWWVSIISGITELTPKMTVLQVVMWIAYLVTVVSAFVLAGRAQSAPAPASAQPAPVSAQPAPVSAQPAADAAVATGPSWWERTVSRRLWPVAGTLVVVPAAVAGLVIAVLPAQAAASTVAVSVTKTSCAREWKSGRTGSQTFAVSNKTSKTGEITIENSSGAIVAEIETLGPATTADMNATLGSGTYTFVCKMASTTLRGSTVQVTGSRQSDAVLAVKPVTLEDLTRPNEQYQTYAAGVLQRLAAEVATLRADIAGNNVAKAKRDWLAGQLDWERVGASYDSFGDNGVAVDGLPSGYPLGVNDPNFTGLHRIEYGLYSGQSAAQLLPFADKLIKDVATVQAKLTTDDEAGDPTNLPLRVHEVLEDAQRDHLAGLDDEGARAAYAMTYADTQVTRVLLGFVSPLIEERSPGLVTTINGQLDTLQAALLATRVNGVWQPPSEASPATRQRINAALGAVLESLSNEPTLLEIPPTH